MLKVLESSSTRKSKCLGGLAREDRVGVCWGSEVGREVDTVQVISTVEFNGGGDDGIV